MKKLNNSKILATSSFLTALEKNKREDHLLKVTYDHLEKQYSAEINSVNNQIFINQNFSYELKFQKYLNSLNNATISRKQSTDYSSYFQCEFPNYFDAINEKIKRSKNYFAPFLAECVRRQEANSTRKLSDMLDYDPKTAKKAVQQVSSDNKSFKESRSNSLASETTATTLTRSTSAISYSIPRKSLPDIEQIKKKRVKSAFQLGDDSNLLSKSIRRERASASLHNEKYREKLKVARLAKQFILYNKYYCSRRCDLRNEK